MKTTADFEIQDEGSIVLFRPLSEAAKEWVRECLPDDAQWFGDAVAVEHRYASNIIVGITSDGMEIENAAK